MILPIYLYGQPVLRKEAEEIEKKVNEYCDSLAPAEPATKNERFVYKIEDGDGYCDDQLFL